MGDCLKEMNLFVKDVYFTYFVYEGYGYFMCGEVDLTVLSKIDKKTSPEDWHI